VKELSYADQHIVTSDQIADRVLEYAKLLGRANTADTLSLPAVNASGDVHTVDLLIGPASQITAVAADADLAEIASSATLADIDQRIRAVQPERAVVGEAAVADAYDPDLPWAGEEQE
jgi:hypothetical protein